MAGFIITYILLVLSNTALGYEQYHIYVNPKPQCFINSDTTISCINDIEEAVKIQEKACREQGNVVILKQSDGSCPEQPFRFNRGEVNVIGENKLYNESNIITFVDTRFIDVEGNLTKGLIPGDAATTLDVTITRGSSGFDMLRPGFFTVRFSTNGAVVRVRKDEVCCSKTECYNGFLHENLTITGTVDDYVTCSSGNGRFLVVVGDGVQKERIDNEHIYYRYIETTNPDFYFPDATTIRPKEKIGYFASDHVYNPKLDTSMDINIFQEVIAESHEMFNGQTRKKRAIESTNKLAAPVSYVAIGGFDFILSATVSAQLIRLAKTVQDGFRANDRNWAKAKTLFDDLNKNTTAIWIEIADLHLKQARVQKRINLLQQEHIDLELRTEHIYHRLSELGKGLLTNLNLQAKPKAEINTMKRDAQFENATATDINDVILEAHTDTYSVYYYGNVFNKTGVASGEVSYKTHVVMHGIYYRLCGDGLYPEVKGPIAYFLDTCVYLVKNSSSNLDLVDSFRITDRNELLLRCQNMSCIYMDVQGDFRRTPFKYDTYYDKLDKLLRALGINYTLKPIDSGIHIECDEPKIEVPWGELKRNVTANEVSAKICKVPTSVVDALKNAEKTNKTRAHFEKTDLRLNVTYALLGPLGELIDGIIEDPLGTIKSLVSKVVDAIDPFKDFPFQTIGVIVCLACIGVAFLLVVSYFIHKKRKGNFS